ncbi:MAG: hypothetical protein JNL67_01630 [Planctomycetaceae bacterium]|nr:hypothetical protein [Planctomycetaceae bacterium]
MPKTIFVDPYSQHVLNCRDFVDEDSKFPTDIWADYPRSESPLTEKSDVPKPVSEAPEQQTSSGMFRQFHDELHRSLSFQLHNPFDEVRKQLEKTIQQAITIPKINQLTSYVENIHSLQQIQQEQLVRVLGVSAASVSALESATKCATSISEAARSVSAFLKFHDVFLRQQEQIRAVVDQAFALNLRARVKSTRKQRTISKPMDSKVDRPFSILLTALRNGLDSANSAAIDAVLEIQSTPIPANDLAETIHLLVGFVTKHRGTNSQKLLIAVGAAIRKVLLNLPSVDLGLAVDLMKSEGSLAVPIGVELEVAKMVVQRVIEDPSIDASQFPELADNLLCNARLYSTAKMVNREFYNATALNSVLACLLLQHPETHALSTQILRDSPSWFSRLCANRLNRIRTELISRNDSKSRGLVEHLISLPILAGNDIETRGGHGA